MYVREIVEQLLKLPQNARAVIRNGVEGVDYVSSVTVEQIKQNAHTERYCGDHELIYDSKEKGDEEVVYIS